MKKPLALTDNQLHLIKHAARSLLVDARDHFLQSVAAHLADQPSDSAVQAAVVAALDRTPVFLCDAKPSWPASSGPHNGSPPCG
jgi:hypothetical protein